MTVLGNRVLRVEDEDLLRGKGRFVDDIHLPGMLHAAFVRSSFGHAATPAVRLYRRELGPQRRDQVPLHQAAEAGCRR